MFISDEEVKKKIKRLWIAVGIMWLVLLVVLSIAAASLGWPWYIGMVAGFLLSFVAVVFEGEVEDRILVNAYGPDKRP